MITGDARVLFVAAAIFCGSLVLLAVLLRAAGVRPISLLTPREWRLFGKVVAVAVCALILLLRLINSELAASMFIYGRF